MKRKILIADDEESIKAIIRRVFSDYIVLSADDGAAAVRIIAAERPSVVLLDLNMPIMSGLEVLCVHKDDEDAPLFIILTGNDDLETAEKSIEMGAISYVTKPFKIEVIRKVVLSALGDTEGGRRSSDRPWKVKRNKD